MMACRFLPGSRFGRFLTVVVALLFLGGICLVTAPAPAADPPKTPPQKPDPPPKPADKDTKTTPPATGNNVADTIQFINDQLAAAWKDNKIKPAGMCDDYEFIRRASLDIIGRVATPDEIEQYLKDPKDSRRAKLI